MGIEEIYLGNKEVSAIVSESLGLEDDYVKHLLESDDWSMMILAWALLEASLNDAIINRLRNQELRSFVEKLSIAGKSGKVDLALSLGVIDKERSNFIRKFSEVRNGFAHRLNCYKITFDKFFADLDQNQKSQFEQALFLHPPIENSNKGPFKAGEEVPEYFTFEDDKRFMILTHVIVLCIELIKKAEPPINDEPTTKYQP